MLRRIVQEEGKLHGNSVALRTPLWCVKIVDVDVSSFNPDWNRAFIMRVIHSISFSSSHRVVKPNFFHSRSQVAGPANSEIVHLFLASEAFLSYLCLIFTMTSPKRNPVSKVAVSVPSAHFSKFSMCNAVP